MVPWRIKAKHVTRVEGMLKITSGCGTFPSRPEFFPHLDIRSGQRLGSRDGIITRAAMQGIVSESTVNNIVRGRRTEQGILSLIAALNIKRCQIDGFLQLTAYVDRRLLHLAWGRDDLVECLADGHRGDAVKRFVLSIPARGNSTVVADDAVVSGAARDPIVSITTDQIIVLAVTEQRVVTHHTVDEIIPSFSMNFIGCTDVVYCHGSVVQSS